MYPPRDTRCGGRTNGGRGCSAPVWQCPLPDRPESGRAGSSVGGSSTRPAGVGGGPSRDWRMSVRQQAGMGGPGAWCRRRGESVSLRGMAALRVRKVALCSISMSAMRCVSRRPLPARRRTGFGAAGKQVADENEDVDHVHGPVEVGIPRARRGSPVVRGRRCARRPTSPRCLGGDRGAGLPVAAGIVGPVGARAGCRRRMWAGL